MSYSGNQAHIPLAQIGLLADLPPGDVPRGALIKAFDVSYETGILTKARGSLRYNLNDALSAGVVAVFDWWPTTVQQRLIAATRDGKIFRDIGDRTFGSATAITTGLNSFDDNSSFVEGGNEVALNPKKLFFFTGSNQLKVLSGDGNSFADISAPATDWATPNFPKIGLTHRNRLWGFLGQRAYASQTADHENFTSSFLTQPIYPGEGGDIIGAFVYRGRLFAFKEGSFVYYLDEAATDSAAWFWRKLASNFGLASPQGIIQVGNDMLAMNESGSPISYQSVDKFGDIESGDILSIMQVEEYYRNNSSLNGVGFTHALYYEAKKQVFFTSRSTYKTTNDQLLHIDFNKPTPRVALWRKDQANCLSLRKDMNRVQRPIYGAEDGYVYLMDQEDRLVGTSAFQGQFKTGHTDFRWLDQNVAQKNKLFDFLEVEFVPQGNWDLSIDVYVDGQFQETITFKMDVRDDGLDTFTLGTDKLGREETQTIRKPLHGSGRRISFDCKQAGSNQNFAIASLTVGFRVSAEQSFREA